jgi:tRNA nucleotidyltransferase/poly(A) polymerase
MNKPSSTKAEQIALSIVQHLEKAGFHAYWVGGCVRDTLMGRVPKDYDVATNATPDQILSIFPRALEIGKAFGVVKVVIEGESLDVATFRRDTSYEDGRRPTAVVFTNAEEDARRRDFTINGLFYDPASKRVIDYVGGQKDIAARVIRTIGHPEKRFSEDYLRMLRAIRFASTLEFDIESDTLSAIRAMSPRITKVSAERIQYELTRLLTESPRAGNGLKILREAGLLKFILPEIEQMIGQEQPHAYHPEGEVFTHTVLMLDAMRNPSVPLAYSVLLHDVGKPATAEKTVESDGSGRWRFHGHAKTGSEIAEQILKRLKLPSLDIEVVTHCIRNHMHFMDAQKMRKSTLRQFVGAPTFPIELELHRLDCLSSHGDLTNYAFLEKFMNDLRNEPILPSPWITGHDIISLGIPEGRQVGFWHKKAYEAQLEGRFENRDGLLAWLNSELTKIHGKSG